MENNPESKEQAIAQVARTGLDASGKSKSKIKTAYFGTIGKHYDFMFTLVGKYNWGKDCFIEGHDRSGHKLLIRVENAEDWDGLGIEEIVVVRGQILAHDKLFGEEVTYVESSSVPTKI